VPDVVVNNAGIGMAARSWTLAGELAAGID